MILKASVRFTTNVNLAQRARHQTDMVEVPGPILIGGNFAWWFFFCNLQHRQLCQLYVIKKKLDYRSWLTTPRLGELISKCPYAINYFINKLRSLFFSRIRFKVHSHRAKLIEKREAESYFYWCFWLASVCVYVFEFQFELNGYSRNLNLTASSRQKHQYLHVGNSSVSIGLKLNSNSVSYL